MSQRRSWQEIRPLIGGPVGLCPDNNQLLPFVNEAIEQFWSMGDWVGKNQRYKVRVTMDCHGRRCLVWPRQIETIEAVNACDTPIGVRTQYFSFINNSGHSESRCGGYPLLIDRQEVCIHHDLIGTPKRLRIYTERIETTGQILLLGYNDAGNVIRTETAPASGVYQTGEYLDLTSNGATTTSYFAEPGPYGVQFTSTPRNGSVYLYSVDDDGVERQLATYDYSESVPVMRRSLLSGLGGRWNSSSTEEARCHCVTVLGKTRFLPIQFDTDFPQISNVPALKAMLQYIYKRDNGKPQEAEYYKQEAINILNSELKQFNGYGAKKILPFLPRQLAGASYNVM